MKATLTMFKKCGKCGYEWETRKDFLDDENIELVGYQAHFENLELGLFLFNHVNCKTTLSVYAKCFMDLYTGPIFSENKNGQNDCPGFCLEKRSLSPCPVQCECACIRELIDIITKASLKET